MTQHAKSLERRADVVFGLFAVAYSTAVWWPTRRLPYHWDSATFVVDASRDLLASGFRPLVASHSDFAHPPLFVSLLALAWRWFGESRAVSHALVAPSLPLAMMGTYRLGRQVGDVALGAAAGVLFAGAAVVVAEYGQVYMDLPVAAVLVWAIAAWLDERRAGAACLFCLAAMMKLPAPLTVPAALALGLARDPRQRRDLAAWLALGAPLFLTGLWLAYHEAATGWLLVRPGRTVTSPHDAETLLRSTATVGRLLLLDKWRWVLTAAACAALAWVRIVRKAWIDLRPLAPHLTIVLTGWAFFAAVGEFGPRYGLYLLPSYVVAAVYLVRAATPRATHLAAGIAVLFALFVTTWHPRRSLTSAYAFAPDDDLAYLDLIAIGERAAHWLETKHPDAEIYGAGPEAYQTTEPWQGYVTRPLHFAWCRAFERHPGALQLVYVHPYHPGQPGCRQLVETVAARPVKLFESNGKWLEVYRVPPDVGAPSATPAGTK